MTQLVLLILYMLYHIFLFYRALIFVELGF